MSFYKFKPQDIFTVSIHTNPSSKVNMDGDQVTGSVNLEKPYLNSDLNNRLAYGFSRKLGGFTSASFPLTSSISLLDAQQDTASNPTYRTILRLYDYYSFFNPSVYSTGSTAVSLFRVINVPQVYYDRAILSGSLTASDWDGSGDIRNLYDDGMGRILSGGTNVGNIFYDEGIIALYGSTINDFGSVSSLNTKWKMSLKGTHTIPTKVFMCRAKSGELNASSNPTFYDTVSGSSEYKNERKMVLTGSDQCTYITKIGLYNRNKELVGTVHLAQAIKKELAQDILFRVRLDF